MARADAARLAAHRRPRPRAGDRARRADARRDDRGAARRTSPSGCSRSIGRQRGGDRSVIFISHRHDRDRRGLRPRDRPARGRDRRRRRRHRGLRGTDRRADARRDRRQSLPARRRARGRGRDRGRHDAAPRRSAASASARSSTTSRSSSIPGEVLGVVALEGQGQDELFDILAGSSAPSGGELLVDGSPVSFRHPADAIRAGLVYVAADRAEALLMQRSVRENIALPFATRIRRWGLIDLGGERKTGRRGGRDAADRRPGRVRGAPALRRQPAEGDHRPLGRRRRADDALLRPDARHRHPDQAPDLRPAPRPGRGRRRGPALHVRAEGDPARVRPGDRDLRRPGRRGDRRGRRGRADAPAGGVQPAADAEMPEAWPPPRPSAADEGRWHRRRPLAERRSRCTEPDDDR